MLLLFAVVVDYGDYHLSTRCVFCRSIYLVDARSFLP